MSFETTEPVSVVFLLTHSQEFIGQCYVKCVLALSRQNLNNHGEGYVGKRTYFLCDLHKVPKITSSDPLPRCNAGLETYSGNPKSNYKSSLSLLPGPQGVTVDSAPKLVSVN